MRKEKRKRGRPVKIKICKGCGKEFTKRQGAYCLDCSMRRLYENVKQLHEKKGPWYEKWRQAMLTAMYKLLEPKHKASKPKPLRKKSVKQ